MNKDLYKMEYPYKDGIPGHPRMDVSKRAKIFMPFAALKGFQEELALQEYKPCPRREIFSDEADELNRKLKDIYEGIEAGIKPYIRILFFRATGMDDFDGEIGDYVELKGEVNKIDLNSQKIFLDGAGIPLGDIVEISEE